MHSDLKYLVSVTFSLVVVLTGGVFGQTDPLVSKSIPFLFADQDHLWAIGADGLHYSLIDPFPVTATLKNGTLPFHGPVRGGVGRSTSLLLFQNFLKSDSVTVAFIGAMNQDGKTNLDSLIFLRSKLHNNLITLGVEFSALALRADTLILGGGRAGFALIKLRTEGQGLLPADSLGFRALADGVDTTVASLRCAPNKSCAVDGLDAVTKVGEPDSISALAVDSSAIDSIWLLIGTQTGLRRGLVGGNAFPAVTLPTDKPGTKLRIESIHTDPVHGILWVFSGSEYFFSKDHGRTFYKPPSISGIATKATDLTGFNPAPQAVNLDDTTFINFNLDRPGLVLFRKDSLTANAGSGDFRDVVYDQEDGLSIIRGEGKLTALATARNGGVTVLAVGTSSKGLFLRKTGAGQAGVWTNMNSLKRVKSGLDEIITYPTLFTGVSATGDPEYVNIGYRLKKDGKVTISIFNYAMEKVKTLVEGSRRKGGGSRSEVPTEDRWDGRDAGGRPVSLGIYYILVESDQGEKGWGKAIAVRGRNP